MEHDLDVKNDTESALHATIRHDTNIMTKKLKLSQINNVTYTQQKLTVKNS